MKAFSFASRETANDPSCVIYDLRGYIDAHTVIDFEKAIYTAIDSGIKCVILDISGLSYISSAGIGAMMGLTRKLTQSGGDLVLLNPSPKVFAILDGLGFTRIFKIANDEAAAIELIKAGSH
jgi:anti-anti-sigma factor